MSSTLSLATAEKRTPSAKLAAAFRLAAEAIEEMGARPEAPKPEAPASVVSPKAAAELLGVSVRMIYHLVKRKELPALRVGAAVRIPSRELEAFRRRRLTR